MGLTVDQQAAKARAFALTAYDEGDYARALALLLPRGRAWATGPDSVLQRLMAAISAPFAALDLRIRRLWAEADPDQALELLEEWEALLGLPDPCVGTNPGLRSRQRIAAARLAAQGGQTIAYLKSLAARVGFVVEIEEHQAITCESAVGGPILSDAWAFVISVWVLDPELYPAPDRDPDVIAAATVTQGWLTCEGSCDEPLRTFGSDVLECVLRRAAPAHAVVQLLYDIPPEPALWFDFAPAPAN